MLSWLRQAIFMRGCCQSLTTQLALQRKENFLAFKLLTIFYVYRTPNANRVK